MDKLRKPFLLAAIILSLLVVAIELGTGAFPNLMKFLNGPSEGPPGVGIPTMALIDIPLAFTLILFGLGCIVPHPALARIQGCATLIVGILVLLGAIVAVFLALTLLLLMIGLIASFFGIIVYLAVFGDFARELAGVILGFLLMLKVAIAILLVLAHQRFLENKGLVVLVVTSLVANVIISFLHGLVPIVVVSITDAVAAIILAILAIVWAILLIIGAIISIVRILRPEKHELPKMTAIRERENVAVPNGVSTVTAPIEGP
jgi:hypothetical protein